VVPNLRKGPNAIARGRAAGAEPGVSALASSRMDRPVKPGDDGLLFG
jgi:hypothetical protein